MTTSIHELPEQLLGDELSTEVVQYIAAQTGEPTEQVRRQVLECLRYLYLVSRYQDELAGLFLPVEQCIDEIWHYLILQTKPYRELCTERLPGGFFIEHRSISYGDYQPDRATAATEALRWIPLYCKEFGPFDEEALRYWTMPRFLRDQMGLSLDEIAALPEQS